MEYDKIQMQVNLLTLAITAILKVVDGMAIGAGIAIVMKVLGV